MKWQEPWRAMLDEREPYKIDFRHVRKALMYAIGLSGFMVLLAALSPETTVIKVMPRLWFTIPVGAALVVLEYTLYWVCPGKVGSGPRGIVHETGGRLLLIPWGAIADYQIASEPKAKVLLIKTKQGQQHRLLMPSTLHTGAVESEIRSHLG